MNVTKSLTKHIEDSATENERPIKISFILKHPERRCSKKDFLLSDPVDDGLICVLKTLESCKTTKVYGSDSGKLVVKSVYTKCLHYYLYYLDKEYC